MKSLFLLAIMTALLLTSCASTGPSTCYDSSSYSGSQMRRSSYRSCCH
ncbi:MAG: hypothetical protein U1F71_07765 [Verrucomicrobiaceae bacterium]